MPNQHYDYFIIGQGIAGSILAFELIKRGRSVLVLDNHHYHSASLLAAGIINPISGHRLNITDHFSEFIEPAKRFYALSSKQFETQFFHELRQYRLLKTQGQFDYWQKRCEQSEYNEFLGQRYETHDSFCHHAFGIVQILQSGYVDVVSLLNSITQFLLVKDSLLQIAVDYDAIEYHQDKVQISSYTASSIIFCEGYQAINNPILKGLPFKLSKGDVLSLDVKNGDDSIMMNWGNWLTPSNQQFKLGSSYVWEDINPTPDEKIKEKLLTSLQKYTGLGYQLVDHQSGIRPTTKQRQPFIGKISDVNNAYCFNGFGSKACLLVPYYANEFVEYLITGKPLTKEVTQWL